LAEVACELEHPAAYAEVKRYSCHHQQHAKLEVDQWAIVAKIEQEDEALSGIKHCMEAYGLHKRLAHLQGHLDIQWDFLSRNFALHRPNSRHCHHGGPEGPP